QHISQLVRGYPDFQALDAEVLVVTPTAPPRAQVYVQKFGIPFPYLCDPDYRVRRLYGVDHRSRSVAGYASALFPGARPPKPPEAFQDPPPPFGELRNLLSDDDMGFSILDRNAVVRYALAGSYVADGGVRAIPSNEEIVRQLQHCQQSPAGSS